MGDVVHLRAFAKINYALEILGLREDGYHEVATVMQSISLADEIEIEKARGGFGLLVEPDRAEVGPTASNTVYRAWSLVCEAAGEELPVRVRLSKKIPSGAGLGGASADAAAALVGLNEIFGLGMSLQSLQKLGVRVGADVPFCITGGTALGEGIGERLTQLPAPPDHSVLILKPERSAETARIYLAYDKKKFDPGHAGPVEPVLAALDSGDLGELALSLGNDLSKTTRDFVPEISDCERELMEAGALGVCMSGTGTAVYGLCAKEEVRMVYGNPTASFVGTCSPIAYGVEITGF